MEEIRKDIDAGLVNEYHAKAMNKITGLIKGEDKVPDNKEIYDRLDRIVRDAEYAFWAVVAEEYQEIKTGDCDPFDAIRFTETLKCQIISWYVTNLGEMTAETKKKEEAYRQYLRS